MSWLTSQPRLGSIVEALRHGPRESGLNPDNLRVLSNDREQVRHGYAAFAIDMAIMMVTGGLTAEDVTDPGTDVAFPESVVALFRADIGQPFGGFPRGLQRKILVGAQPSTSRPGEHLPRALFYGLEAGEEITVDLEKGKRLIIRYVTTSDLHDGGTRTVLPGHAAARGNLMATPGA
ncbi:MAG: hypothetical protein V9E93_04795 [Steroidobacteraceae bacterium]|mgnify:FL=1|nr:hypothetical protein [Steroidobacteraceae bacterium]MBP7014386.1 hypothetical protein [Steroidobacteraceae bacterium]